MALNTWRKLNATDKSASSPPAPPQHVQAVAMTSCHVITEKPYLCFGLFFSFFISGSAHYKATVFYALSEAVPSIIMTVILSKLRAASATQMTPQLLLIKWSFWSSVFFKSFWPFVRPPAWRSTSGSDLQIKLWKRQWKVLFDTWSVQ